MPYWGDEAKDARHASNQYSAFLLVTNHLYLAAARPEIVSLHMYFVTAATTWVLAPGDADGAGLLGNGGRGALLSLEPCGHEY